MSVRSPAAKPAHSRTRPELLEPVPPHGVPDLADHVQDRAAGNAVEGQLERLRVDVVAHHRSQEDRARRRPARRASSQLHEGRTFPSGPTIPKPSVALCSAKPMISTVARPISPVLAETPIASPSAKLWIPIAAAIVMPKPQRAPAADDPPRPRQGPAPARPSSRRRDPPAIGGRSVERRMRRSRIARPAQPTAKPPASISGKPIALPSEPSPAS